MYDLLRPSDKRRHQTSASTDHEPLQWLLRDAYADLATCAFWRVRATLGGDDGAFAGRRYQRQYERATDAIATLAGSGALTPLGGEFVGRMLAALKATPL